MHHISSIFTKQRLLGTYVYSLLRYIWFQCVTDSNYSNSAFQNILTPQFILFQTYGGHRKNSFERSPNLHSQFGKHGPLFSHDILRKWRNNDDNNDWMVNIMVIILIWLLSQKLWFNSWLLHCEKGQYIWTKVNLYPFLGTAQNDFSLLISSLNSEACYPLDALNILSDF